MEKERRISRLKIMSSQKNNYYFVPRYQIVFARLKFLVIMHVAGVSLNISRNISYLYGNICELSGKLRGVSSWDIPVHKSPIVYVKQRGDCPKGCSAPGNDFG